MAKKSLKRNELDLFLTKLFSDINLEEDYAPNGLQIEGRKQITKIAFAVSATQASITEAIEKNADTLIVHHGLFWNANNARPITGSSYARIAPIIKNDLNLYAFHLPLDGHPTVGNAVSIANQLGLKELAPFGSYKKTTTGIMGNLSRVTTGENLFKKLQKLFDRPIFHASPHNKKIQSIGIITGGASSGWREAQKFNLDCYITGEMSEHDYNDALEAGIHFFGCGHHQTERGGVIALSELIKKTLGVETFFIDGKTPA